MTPPFRAAAIQMSSGEDQAANLAAAVAWVEQAADQGARLVVLPEMFACLGRTDRMVASAETIPGPTSQTLSELARRLSITLVAGSFCERSSVPDRAYNTSLLFGPDGRLLATYRKMHLFDIDLPGQVRSRESSWLVAGDEVTATTTTIGCLGQAICYDLRFPALFERLSEAGVEILCIPAAFTRTTGRDHWDVLLRARAIENQSFVIAANQTGQHTPEFSTYGHSAIIDPWGTPLAVAGDEPGMVLAEIDPARVREVRSRLPALANRRTVRAAARPAS